MGNLAYLGGYREMKIARLCQKLHTNRIQLIIPKEPASIQIGSKDCLEYNYEDSI
jgi:hypothetical protein